MTDHPEDLIPLRSEPVRMLLLALAACEIERKEALELARVPKLADDSKRHKKL